MKTFADRLRWARQRQGLSQGDLARACKMSQSAISSYENGTRLSSKKLLSIAQVLGVNIYWLSHGEGEIETRSVQSLDANENTWPFPSVEPDRYWKLGLQDRQEIEKTVATMIIGMEAMRDRKC